MYTLMSAEIHTTCPGPNIESMSTVWAGQDWENIGLYILAKKDAHHRFHHG